jgi:hypothetical protein
MVRDSRPFRRLAAMAALAGGAVAVAGATIERLAAQTPAPAAIRAVARPAPTPAWTKGIQPISPESYYNAIECGKQGGQDPPCVFWDTGLCKNSDFAIAMFTPYKFVAYDVWAAVRAGKPAPQPSYPQAQQTRITLGITPVRGSTNTFTDLTLKRGGQAVAPVARSVNASDSRFTFDYPAFAPTGSVTIDLAGKSRTISCVIDAKVLGQFR